MLVSGRIWAAERWIGATIGHAHGVEGAVQGALWQIRHWYYGKLLAFSAFPALPLLVLVGYYADVPWLLPAIAFVGIPALDLAIGPDRTEPLDSSAPRLATAWLRTMPRLYVFLWLGTLAWAAHTLAYEATGPTAVWLVVSVAIATAFATCVAHELVHWPSAFDRGLARLIMATVAYGPFPFEHLHHHAKVGVASEGTTPPLGQSVWGAVTKNAQFTLRSAWRIERRRQLAKRQRLVLNRYVQQWLLTAFVIVVFAMIGGPWGLALFLAQAAFGIFTTEYVNYAQHYGLSRDAPAPPRGSLSWNSNGFMTNAFTLNITRHVHHHLDADVPYYDLRHIESMPVLPAGYLALFFPALIPSLWRRLMDARARRFATSAG
ncbi:MAG: fatty acid desaturase [Burkholderiales bacterium]